MSHQIPDTVDQLLQLSSHRCEYCREDLSGSLFHLEHVVPKALGGSSETRNLAISCARCNLNKGLRTAYEDPFTHDVQPLFDPRSMNWSTHFKARDHEVIGITPTGRATATLLFRSTRRYSPPDLQWDRLQALAGDEPLYRFFNHLRFQRLQNQFERLEALLSCPPDLEIRPEYETSAKHIGELLLLEIRLTRATPQDLTQGISLGEGLLETRNDWSPEELMGILSTLYQQRATQRFTQGDHRGAFADQQRSYQLHFKAQGDSTWFQHYPHKATDLRRWLRSVAIGAKYESVPLTRQRFADLLNLATDSDSEKDFQHLVYLVDVALIADPLPAEKVLRTVYWVLSTILERGGYGSAMDVVRLVSLRRRWWMLHFLLEDPLWIEALRSDLVSWMGSGLHNEIRELYLMVIRHKDRLRLASLHEVIDAFEPVTRVLLA